MAAGSVWDDPLYVQSSGETVVPRPARGDDPPAKPILERDRVVVGRGPWRGVRVGWDRLAADGRGDIEGGGLGVAGVVDAGQQRHGPLGAVEQAVAVRQEPDALLVLGPGRRPARARRTPGRPRSVPVVSGRLRTSDRVPRSGLPFDAAEEPARGEPGLDQVAGPDVVGRAERGGAAGREGQAVAAGEDGQGAERLERGGEAGEAVAAAVEVAARWRVGRGRPGRRGGRGPAGTGASPDRASRSARRSSAWRTSRASGTQISPASLGVRARRSAARSAIVTSTSWPIAETTGSRDATIARATTSSLNAQRSSRLPPPRATMIRSAPATRLASASAAATSSAAPGPWTLRRRDQDLGGPPAPADDLEQVADRRAGRAGHDHDPPGEPGQGPLPRRVEQPLGRQPGHRLAERQLERADPLGLDPLGS